MRHGIGLALVLLSASLCPRAQAQPAARFDLIGPSIEVRVTRAGKTLPIAYVPNLQPGDKLWLHPDLPPTQSVHLLLIVAFLRGTTNPPPDDWFTKIETWNRKTNEGVTVTVPDEAQQAILFLAPETGGDFATLKKAVRGRPGIFVRASQDLSEAGFEQARVEKYVASMRQVPPADSKALLDHSNLLARTLNLRPNDECFKRPVDLQANCLTQAGNQTLLDDQHAQSVISVLANGSNSDFITAASYTNVAGGGTYSAYVGAAVDLFRILGNLHTAQFQYIPAISVPDPVLEPASLNLRLNTPPSFRNPKSVIVIGLPSIQKAVPPPLRPTDPNLVACLLKPKVVLPIEGAPLVYSTSFAHDVVLHFNPADSSAFIKDIPLVPDAYQGGLVVDHPPERRLLPAPPGPEVPSPNLPEAKPVDAKPATPASLPTPQPYGTATITGSWGFDPFTGPTLNLQSLPGANWKLAADETLIAGHDDHVLIASNGTACIQSIQIQSTQAQSSQTQSPPSQPPSLDPHPQSANTADWKPANVPNLIDVRLPLKSINPGDLRIAIQQFGDQLGDDAPAIVTARTFSPPATLISLMLRAGDTAATLTGTNLYQVRQVTLSNTSFSPAADPEAATASPSNPTPQPGAETLRLTLPEAATPPTLKPGQKLSATVTLKDGRTLSLPVTVAPARPVISLLSRNMGRPADATLRLASEDDLPINQLLTFSLKSSAPFPRSGQIQIATQDESLQATLTVADGTLILQNPHTLLGTFDPLKSFGTSAFGPIRLRAITPDGTPNGVAGDWLPLANLVRLPTLTNLRCPPDPTAPCTLTGANLYLLQSLSPDPAFTNPTTIPEGFVASSIAIPRPTNLPATLSPTRPTAIALYLHLRDDPTPTNTATIPVLPATTTPLAAWGTPTPNP